MNKVKSIMEFAIRMEKNARDFYSYYAGLAKSEETKKLFFELSEIENNHALHLQKKYDSLGFENPPKAISWVVDDTSRSIDPHIIADNSDLLAVDGKGDTDISIIRMAFLIEDDFAHFYGKAVDAVEEQDIKDFLNEMKNWEIQHKDMFYAKYTKLLNEQWSDIMSILL